MISFAPAKINIGLSVFEKRLDGFHNLESILYPVPLYDIIEIRKNDKDELIQTGIFSTNTMEQNLAYQAVLLIRKHYFVPSVKIHLHKQIPVQAGLGGGSSNAASVLKLINSQFNLQIPNEEMHQFALELGSDCPFFIEGKAAKISGKGDLINPIGLSLQHLFIMIAKPSFSINTSDAFQRLKTKKSNPLLEISIEEIKKWPHQFINDFEVGLAINHPEIKKIKETFLKNGALYASLSGSGSAVYGLFHSLPKIKINSSYFNWTGRLL